MLGDRISVPNSEAGRESQVVGFRVEAPALYLGVAMTYRDDVVIPRACLQRVAATRFGS